MIVQELKHPYNNAAMVNLFVGGVFVCLEYVILIAGSKLRVYEILHLKMFSQLQMCWSLKKIT